MRARSAHAHQQINATNVYLKGRHGSLSLMHTISATQDVRLDVRRAQVRVGHPRGRRADRALFLSGRRETPPASGDSGASGGWNDLRPAFDDPGTL